MTRDIRDFFASLACLKTSKHFKPALWTMVASMLFIATSQTTAYGLEFPMTTRLALPASKNLTVAGNMPTAALISQTSEMALVAYAMQQVNQAREERGAKRAWQRRSWTLNILGMIASTHALIASGPKRVIGITRPVISEPVHTEFHRRYLLTRWR